MVKGGRVVAGVVYDRCNGHHIEACIAAVPGSGWADRDTLRQLFGYPFNQLGVQAITVLVPYDNLDSLHLATKLGFKPTAIVPFAARGGVPLVILQMYRQDCGWLLHGQKKQQRAEGT